jgi:hypothetical protein
LIQSSSAETLEKTDNSQSLVISLVVTPLEIPMTTAVSSDWLLGTTKGPPESPAHTPFPSHPPAQRALALELTLHWWSWSKGNATYSKFCEIGPASTMRQQKND